MKHTLLRGDTTIYGKDVCGSMASRTPNPGNAKRQRVLLKQGHWEEVMRAGLANHRVVALESKGLDVSASMGGLKLHVAA